MGKRVLFSVDLGESSAYRFFDRAYGIIIVYTDGTCSYCGDTWSNMDDMMDELQLYYPCLADDADDPMGAHVVNKILDSDDLVELAAQQIEDGTAPIVWSSSMCVDAREVEQ